MSKIVYHTNNRINETIAHLQKVESYSKSTDKTEIDALSGLMYFRGLHGVNLYLTDDHFNQTVNFFFSPFVSKNRV